MQWSSVLKLIREDFESFLERGGWRFLQDEADEEEEGEAEDSELEEDPEFKDDAEEDSEDFDDSEFSDDVDDEYGSDDDFSEEEEGPDWEDNFKQAMEDDRQAAQRRQDDGRGSKGKRASGRR